MTVFTSCASSVFLSSYRNTIFNQSAFIFLGLFCTVNVLFAQKPPGIVSTPRRVIGDSKGKAKERGEERKFLKQSVNKTLNGLFQKKSAPPRWMRFWKFSREGGGSKTLEIQAGGWLN